MDDQERLIEESAGARLRDARRARLAARRARLLAAELAARLEARLREAEEAGMRAEITRRLELKRRLLAVQKVTKETQASRQAGRRPIRKPLARYGLAAAFGLLAGTAAVVLAPFAADASGSLEAPPPVFALPSAPGDRLKLALSYTIQAPVNR